MTQRKEPTPNGFTLFCSKMLQCT